MQDEEGIHFNPKMEVTDLFGGRRRNPPGEWNVIIGLSTRGLTLVLEPRILIVTMENLFNVLGVYCISLFNPTK
jgi:hypothetical protein